MEASNECFPRRGSKRKMIARDQNDKIPSKKKYLILPDKSEFQYVECLNAGNISDGMVLLGFITEVKNTQLKVALPGCLIGTVSITDISLSYSRLLETYSCNDSKKPIATLHDMFQVAETYPFKVISVQKQPKYNNSSIKLSLNPSDVNCDLRPSSLSCNMIISSAVSSIEDHGYIMDVGIAGLGGFIKFSHLQTHSLLNIGQIVRSRVESFKSSTSKVVLLVPHPMHQAVPQLSNKAALDSLLPGTTVKAVVTETCKQGLILDCMGYEAFISKHHLPPGMKCEEIVSSEVTATVLYLDPLPRRLHLTLNTISNSSQYKTLHSLWKKWDLIENAKMTSADEKSIYFNIGHKYMKGQALKKELVSDVNFSTNENSNIHRCRVLDIHPMDNIIRVTLKQNLVNMKMLTKKDLTVGTLLKGKVLKYNKNGMLVQLSPNARGFVRDVHLAKDASKNPEKMHKIGAKVQCRVLKIDVNSSPYMVQLTCRKELFHSDLNVLSSYKKAHPALLTKGVVVRVSSKNILLSFFNDVQGIVPLCDTLNSNALKSYSIGQVLKCKVTYCKPEQKILHLSLNIYEESPNNEECNFPSLDADVEYVANVCVKSKGKTGFEVQLINSSITAFLPYGHLTDYVDHTCVMSDLYSVNDILSVVLLRTKQSIIATSKFLFLQAAERKKIPLQISGLHIGDIVLAAVKSFDDDGMVLDMGSNITGYVPKRLMKDFNASSCGFTINQTVVAKVMKITSNHIELNTHLKDIYNKDPDYSLDALESYLNMREKIRLLYKPHNDSMKNLTTFVVGEVVSAMICDISSNIVYCELEGGISGISTLTSDEKESLEKGKVFKAVILFVDYQLQVVEVSFSRHLVKCASQRKNIKDSEVKTGQVIKSKALFISKEFVLVALGGHAVGSFAYLPCRRVVNDEIGRHKLYSLGQSYHVMIKRICDGKILGVLEKHNRLYEYVKYQKVAGTNGNSYHNSQTEISTLGHHISSLHLKSSETVNIPKVCDVCYTTVTTCAHAIESLIGSTTTAMITNVKKLQMYVIINDSLKGRVHITNLGCSEEGEFPLRAYSKGMKVDVKILGCHKRRSYNHLEISHRTFTYYADCAILRISCISSVSPSIGENVLGFIEKIEDEGLLCCLSSHQRAELSFLHMSQVLKEIRTIKKTLKIGQSVQGLVTKYTSSNMILSKLDNWKPVQHENVVAYVQVSSPDKGLIVQLPHDYSGEISMTDISDNYDVTESTIMKFLKQKFICCHVLEVDEAAKKCILSTRASRLNNQKNQPVDRELSLSDIAEGQYFRGFVTSVESSAVHVNISRNITGVLKLDILKGNDHIESDYKNGTVLQVKVMSVAPKLILKLIEKHNTNMAATDMHL